MIIQCKSCSKKFTVKDSDIPKEGRIVQCGYCSDTWHQMPVLKKTTKVEKIKVKKPVIKSEESPSIDNIEESPSIDNIIASDDKTYKFLGSQWAELLPSGKTGLFARKKISQELDEVTGRKERKTNKKRQKKLEEVDPSDSIETEKQLNNISKSKKGLGFFGYIFLMIIIGFSIVGISKTFEEDLIFYFPEAEYIYDLLDEQLIYLAESVENIIVIISDLLNSY